MLRNKIYNYFKSNYDLKESTKGWFRFGDAMAVNFNFLKVKNFKAESNHSLLSCIDFIMQEEFLDFSDAIKLVHEYEEAEIFIKNTKLSKEVALPDYFMYLHESKRACRYIESRGLDVKKCTLKGFGYCWNGDYLGYLIIPIYSNGKLVYWIARDIIGNSIRYKNPPIERESVLYNEDALSLYDDVYLVEGWSDAETVGDNCIASLGSTLTNNQLYKITQSDIKSITLIPDKGFFNSWLHLASILSNYKPTFLYKLEDFENGKDVNEIGFENILKTKKLKYHIKLYK